MHAGAELREWVDYDPLWLIVGCLLLSAIILWYGFVFYSTHRRSHRSLATLKPKPYTPPDLTDLKQKYQQLIDEIEQNHAAGKLSSRKAHQKLSHVLRMFVVEINGHRVDTLTLRDLEKTRYKTLAAAIKQFYIPEFTAVEQGSVTEAAALARKTVAAWN